MKKTNKCRRKTNKKYREKTNKCRKKTNKYRTKTNKYRKIMYGGTRSVGVRSRSPLPRGRRFPSSKLEYEINPLLNHIYALAQITHEILKKFNIRYSADAGTLLGLIRHKGNAIPWDDDVDIAVLSKDLDRIIELHDEFYKKGLQMTVKIENSKGQKRLQLSFIRNCNFEESSKRKCFFEKVTLPFLDIIPFEVKKDKDEPYLGISIDWLHKESPKDSYFPIDLFEEQNEVNFGPAKIMMGKPSSCISKLDFAYSGWKDKAYAPIVAHGDNEITFEPIDLKDISKDMSGLYTSNIDESQLEEYNRLISVENYNSDIRTNVPNVIEWKGDDKCGAIYY